MSRLHRGHPRRTGLAGAVVALALALVAVGSPSARADIIGGDLLANPERTVRLLAGADPLPKVRAESWLVADAGSGAVLAHKGAHARRAPASTLKMLTALAVMPNTTPEQSWVATPKAANIYGSRVGLKPGRSYTLDELWYAVFLPSANDAAIAVAEANGGVKHTVDQMNTIARELNARDTVAKTPNGLDHAGQMSSAYDLALIARAGLARPDFAHYAGTAKAQFPDVKGKGSHPIYTTNRLLLHGWKGMIGVKTGFTTQAGRTYVGAATRGGRTILVSLMGIHESSESAAKKLLAWAFANADKVSPVGALVPPGAPAVDEPSTSTGSSTTPGLGTASGGAGTSAAGPTQAPGSLPSGPILAVLALVAIVGAIVTLRRRATRPAGRHAAT